MILNFKVNKQQLELLSNEALANKSNNYLVLHFDFKSSDWSEMVKFCLCKNHKKQVYQFGLDEDDNVVIPSTILGGDHFIISLYGGNTGFERITTNTIRLQLAESNYSANISSIVDYEVDVFVDLYDKLDAKLNIADVDTELDINSTNPAQNKIITGTLNGKADISHTHSIIDLTDFPTFANVATSGSYLDLTDKPTIITLGGDVTLEKQTVPDTGFLATYVLKQGGVAVGDKIQQPKDWLLKSVTINEVTVKDEPVIGYNVGDYYFDFVFNTKDSSASDVHQYLLANVLKDVYHGDNSTIEIVNNIISVKAGGITTTELASSIVTSLGYADAFNQSACKNITSNDISSWNAKQTTANLVTAWNSTLSDTKYPSEKLVKEYVDSCIGNIEEDMLL